jgi:hypothetical protein
LMLLSTNFIFVFLPNFRFSRFGRFSAVFWINLLV